jgi:guanine deaminase
MPNSNNTFIIKCNYLNSLNSNTCEYFANKFLLIENGKIINISSVIQNTDLPLHDFSNKILTAGFIDLHTHLPQIGIIGKANIQLLDWLNKFTFPEEAKFYEYDYAYKKSEEFFNNLISNGTTTAFIFSQSGIEATDIAFEQAEKSGIRIFMGNTIMDINSPINLTHDSIYFKESFKYFLRKWHKKNSLLEYVITPRFAASVSSELMSYAANFAKENDLYIQTHIAENLEEIKYVKSLYPTENSYTHIYNSHHLLNNKTILAHGIYLQQDEIDIIKSKSSIIAHCPCSNCHLKSGIMPLKKYIDLGINLGLGTDIAGGFNFSMLEEAKWALEMSKLYSLYHKTKSISLETAFWLITKSPAESIGRNDIGSIDIGKSADFNLFELENNQSTMNVTEILETLIYKSRKLSNSFVKGVLLHKQDIEFK